MERHELTLSRLLEQPLRKTVTTVRCVITDVQRNLLIDEACTPLIISGEARESSNYYVEFAAPAKRLTPETHYALNEKEMSATLTEEGIAYIERVMGCTITSVKASSPSVGVLWAEASTTVMFWHLLDATLQQLRYGVNLRIESFRAFQKS